MPQTPPATLAQAATSDASFKYIAGDAALDFVNTVDWTSRGLEHDRLTSYERLVEWAEGANIVSPLTGAKLRSISSHASRARDAALQSAVALRAVLQRLLTSVAASRVDGDALRTFDPFVQRALTQRMLVQPGATRRTRRAAPRFTWGWHDAESLEVIAWSVAAHASELLASDEVTLIRLCGGDDCGWFFVDRSRNGLRRWCEMEVCGMKEKNRRRASR